MPRKPKNPQAQTPNEVSTRDLFQTPNYATDILVPFLHNTRPAIPFSSLTVWECAAGLGKIGRRLRERGFNVLETDLSHGMNFLTDIPDWIDSVDVIATNPPFSLKEKFYRRCLEYGVPFALLIPADYSGWTIDAVEKDGCNKIIPTRRIDYITPNILNKIHEGEIWENSKEWLIEQYRFPKDAKLVDFKNLHPDAWKNELDKFPGYCLWETIYDAPAKLLRKYSSSLFHSMWLTRGFNIGKSETFVELSSEEKNNI